jgi:hypothetical protein
VNVVEQTRPASARIALARVAEALLALDTGVEPTVGVGRWVTLDGRRPIAGVVAAEEGDGKVEVELHLVVRWPAPPLTELAAKLRRELRREAVRSGLGSQLGAIGIDFHDLALPSAEGAAT